MIKAKKGLLIALFAAMMVFAFGATSAFANEQGVWTDDFTAVEYGDTVVAATWSFSGETGLTTATVPANKTPAGYDTQTARYFYDFTGATIVSANPIGYDAYVGLGNLPNANGYIKLVKPADADGTSNSAVPDGDTNGFKVNTKLVVDENLDEAGGAAQIAAEVSVTGTGSGVIDNTTVDPAIFGTIAPKDVTVNAKPGSGNAWVAMNNGKEVAGQVYSDGINILTVKYDGNENTVVAKAVKGYTISYGKKEANGSWTAVDAITYQHVTDDAVYRAVFTSTNPDKYGPKDPEVMTLKVVSSAVTPAVYWAANNNLNHDYGQDYDLTAAQAADPVAFIKFANPLGDYDMATIKEFFADVYDVTATPRTSDSNIVDWAVDNKALTLNDKKALNKKYEQLMADYDLANYELIDVALVSYYDVEHHVIVDNDKVVHVTDGGVVNVKDDEVNFTEAPNVTYKAKKIKKKAKSFTVNAVAVSGNAVTYRIDSPSKKITIDSATGKVTVAKGLKKGTYKVIVKAETAAGNGYKAAKAEREITIKVKK